MSLSNTILESLCHSIAVNTHEIQCGDMTVAICDAPQTADSHQAIADWYNIRSDSFYVWRTDIRESDIDAVVDWSEVIKLPSYMMTAFQLIKSQSCINAANSSVRAAFDLIFPQLTCPNTAQNIATIFKRCATRFEQMCAVGEGLRDAPAVLSYEGHITSSDVEQARVC